MNILFYTRTSRLQQCRKPCRSLQVLLFMLKTGGSKNFFMISDWRFFPANTERGLHKMFTEVVTIIVIMKTSDPCPGKLRHSYPRNSTFVPFRFTCHCFPYNVSHSKQEITVINPWNIIVSSILDYSSGSKLLFLSSAIDTWITYYKMLKLRKLAFYR
jgi:hypothetical protein